MFKLYFLLYYEFFKIGLFAIGGGYAAIPFLFDLQREYNWFSLDELTDMIAVSNITPGPVGINMATYTGYTVSGITGAFVSTVAVVSAPFIFAVLIAKIFDKFQENKAVNDVFIGLRAASCALLVSVAIKLLFKNTTGQDFSFALPLSFDYKAFILFLILLFSFWSFKKNPLFSILAGGISGIIIKSFF